jgi:hypothetical protein
MKVYQNTHREIYTTDKYLCTEDWDRSCRPYPTEACR